MKNTLQKITEILLEKYSKDISIYDRSFLEHTVNNRLLSTGKKNLRDYVNYFESSDIEPRDLMDSLQVTFSEFFRFPLTFDYLEQILPSIIEKKRSLKENEVRIWSCACAEGQEPYSIAIIWNEIIQKYKY